MNFPLIALNWSKVPVTVKIINIIETITGFYFI